MTDAKQKPIGVYNPDFIAVMDDETFVYVKGLIEEKDKLLVRIEKLREGLDAIVSAKVSGCVEYKGCECWWQIAEKALKQDDEAKNE